MRTFFLGAALHQLRLHLVKWAFAGDPVSALATSQWWPLHYFLSGFRVGDDMLMNMSDTDLQLLRRYARQHAEDAFAELVCRHLDLVFCAALRQVRSVQLAEDVAQSVFIDLSRNAERLEPNTILTAWLYQVTTRTAIDVIRREARRTLREQVAVELTSMNATAADWTAVEPLLDEAMNALDDGDRTAVLLRYFENKSLREVGEILSTTEEAARKRLTRAIERLREFLTKRGVTVGVSGLAALIAANSVQAAPAGLAASITAAALSGTAITTTTVIAAAKAVAMTTLQKAIVTATVAVLAGAGIYEARQAANARAEVQTLLQQKDVLASLQDSNEDLAQQLKNAIAASQTQQNELLRLRGQGSRLRQLEQENAQLKAQRQQLDQQMQQPQATVLASEQRPTAVSEVVKATADSPPHRDTTDLGSLELQSGIAAHFDLGGGTNCTVTPTALSDGNNMMEIKVCVTNADGTFSELGTSRLTALPGQHCSISVGDRMIALDVKMQTK